jgi:hypothetical protein
MQHSPVCCLLGRILLHDGVRACERSRVGHALQVALRKCPLSHVYANRTCTNQHGHHRCHYEKSISPLAAEELRVIQDMIFLHESEALAE